MLTKMSLASGKSVGTSAVTHLVRCDSSCGIRILEGSGLRLLWISFLGKVGILVSVVLEGLILQLHLYGMMIRNVRAFLSIAVLFCRDLLFLLGQILVYVFPLFLLLFVCSVLLFQIPTLSAFALFPSLAASLAA